MPSKWPFSSFARRGGKPLSLIGSRTQVRKWKNKVSGVREGESLDCVRRKIIPKKIVGSAQSWARGVGFITSAGLGGVLLKVKQDADS